MKVSHETALSYLSRNDDCCRVNPVRIVYLTLVLLVLLDRL